PAPLDAAIASAAQRIRAVTLARGAGAVAGVASAHATNEDLFSFRRLLAALGVEHTGVAVPRGEPDALLVKEEKAANAEGARALGFDDARAVCDALRSGSVAALICMGHDLLAEAYLGDASALAQLDALIVLDSQHSPLQRVAHAMLPTRHAAEREGPLTNHAGRVQRTRAAVEPAFEALAAGDVAFRLGRELGLTGFDAAYDARAVSKELAQAEPAFADIDLDTLGEYGRPLSGR
ncbi:MAG: molybdopterin-dependent oxidoreductase, partial [Deltaproteobacteria bacterium]